MSKYLVIVESPTKAHTISGFLGEDYEVISSMGHVVDLASKRLSVDVEHDFKPQFHVIPGKEKIISQIKKKAKKKKTIYLATDPDREGEAISWHIKEQLTDKNSSFKRVVFHEITEEAIQAAFKKASTLDTHKVNAQIARRVLDRLVGYNLSPLLWKKIVRGLSAGRVQSVALRFIVEREREIERFTATTTYQIESECIANESRFNAQLEKYQGKKAVFETKQAADAASEALKQQSYTVKEIVTKESRRKPPAPYITSSLQQDAFNRLHFSAQRTMLLAQKLYEGVQIGDKSVGLITYMRTDSFHISPKAKSETRDYIAATWGQNYVATSEQRHKKKKGAQLAHEAIRPTSALRTPESVARYLPEDELKLYDLIWRRFVAGLMADVSYENTKALIASKDGEFAADGRRLLFDGFLKIYDADTEHLLPKLEKGQPVTLEKINVTEHTTKPPARYNDASLVKLLEEKGIGRPSTYAPTIDTLLKRYYVRREKRAFMPTDLGCKVNDMLVQFFPTIMDENFTAAMEQRLDDVEEGKNEWNELLHDFYPSFKEKIEDTLRIVQKDVEVSDKICPKCQGRLVVKWSRKGRFLSCEHFPKCRYAENLTSGVQCPGCKTGQLVERRNRRGQFFYGCSTYPACTYTSRNLPSEEGAPADEEKTTETGPGPQ